jgi:His-Xaa-Ser system protein HxsD
MVNDSDIKTVDNLEIHENEGFVIVSVNPKIYPMDIVYSASYVLLDRAYVVLDGNPEEEISVQLRHKDGNGDVESLGRDFNNELLKYAVYKMHSTESKGIREQIVARALQTNLDDGDGCGCSEDETGDDKDSQSDDDYLDDPLGIAKPWEETHKEG